MANDVNHQSAGPAPEGSTHWKSLGWEIDLNRVLDAANIGALLLAEQDVPVEVTKDLSLRAKIIDACGLTCTFCHNEGTPVAVDNRTTEVTIRGITGPSGRISVFSDTNGVNFIPGRMNPEDPNFAESLRIMRDEVGLRELHLTGGEPTLHTALPRLVEVARSIGYSVSMTSNGEKGTDKIANCADAGLGKINFSVFGTTPQELAEVQSEKYKDVDLAARRIDALHRSIEAAADAGIKVAANIVMGDSSHEPRVQRLLEKFDSRLDVRVLPDLSQTHESAQAIYRLLSRLGATPLIASVEAGSSNARVKYVLPNGRMITFKQIRPTRLDTCGDCQFNNPTDCKEGYYGSRLYVDQAGSYLVGICLQRMDLVSPVMDFTQGDLKDQVVKLREAEYTQMATMYQGRG